ncbi:uncharacterized protein SOCE26_088090 [Sorangium cellulosum]|uniref:Peptidase C-terminal archaeal/bacterial domain-containing protein n=1 Tax=Sorangium cellulosum TaxID=56 RepID=A0A2L0F713_SORCE|nr:pre-peptidase C-terminal domain-containing protein [Sorangium cellulosum]AUX47291.1 uncharacterized protein SOCE26_088090 [Sorangium cellulosum]
MERKLLSGLGAGGALALLLAACASGSPSHLDPGSDGYGGGTGAATSSQTTSSSAQTTSSSSASDGSTPERSCADAIHVPLNRRTSGARLEVNGEEDYYSFRARKGQAVYLDIDTVSASLRQREHIDTVLTLFSPDGTQIAENNDSIGLLELESTLYTILPEDGEYCLRVADCFAFYERPEEHCSGLPGRRVTGYDLTVAAMIDGPNDPMTSDRESSDESSAATPVGYLEVQGQYSLSAIWGTFRDPADVDVFSFAVPDDFEQAAVGTRMSADFYIMPSGPEGSGSTAPTGKVTIVDPAEPDVPLAEIDGAGSTHLMAPIELGEEYWLVVRRGSGAIGDNEFYVITHYANDGPPLEMEQGAGANDTPKTAEPLKTSSTSPDLPIDNIARVEGDLVAAPEDIDVFRVEVPPDMGWVSAMCEVRHVGSGLRDFKASLLTEDGDLIAPLATSHEEAHEPTRIRQTPLGGARSLLLKVEAGSQDPAVKSAFYRCAVNFYK